MAQALDLALRQWRDALAAGGLPTPARERWQPLRAGVVNLWEFEAVEYWYANGWAQLMGRNETGKSSLMALTTLIPWLGDTSSDKIDTLGRSGKQFAYYVRPSGESDRRDLEASMFHGWLWVEYGRVRDGACEFFTTLLYASARSAGPTRLTWCTCEGSRVRDELRLTDQRALRTPKEVDAPGFEPQPSAAAYRQQVASRLLGGSIAQLESIGKLLKVARQPKLGAQLKVDFVTGHLRDSLPELSRGEVHQLAQGWDQLDQLRDDLERARRAAAEVARFVRDAWRPWAAAQLRLRADDVAARQTAFDAVTREERAAEVELRDSRQAEGELATARQQTNDRATTRRAEAASLRESSAYREAHLRLANVDQQERETRAARQLVERTASSARDARSRAQEAQEALDRLQAEHAAAVDRLARRLDALCAAARPAGVGCPTPLDPDRLQQAIDERAQEVRRVEALRRAAAEAQSRAHTSEQTSDALQRTADEARHRAEEAWEQAAAEHEQVARALAAWAPDEVGHLVPAWVAALPATTDVGSQPRLRDAIRRDFHDPRHAELSAGRARAHATWRAISDEAVGVREEIEELTHAPSTMPPEPRLWRRRDRSQAAGAPFWQLVNPREGLSGSELAGLEAALAASGLLDAWVSTEAPHALDTFLSDTAAPCPGRSLADVLDVDDAAGAQADLVRAVLDSVSLDGLDDAVPAAGVALSLDGRWRVSNLAGRAAPLHEQAEWLGEPAREAQRQRRLAELQARLADLEARAAAARDDEAMWVARIGELAQVLEQAPTDDGLRQALARCRAVDENAEAQRLEADKALAVARHDRAGADSRGAELRQAARTQRLPITEDGLRDVRLALDETGLELTR